MDTTLDKLLNGRFAVEQPKKGFRIAMDTLMLASAVPAQAGERVLELGCGVGGAMLALAVRVPGVSIVGIEIQKELAALAQANVARNGLQDRVSVRPGDIAALPPDCIGAFAQVMMNPPYHDSKGHDPSANACKRVANTESEETDLAVWLAQGAAALAPGGILTLIHRADRLQDILALLPAVFAEAQIKPLCPKPDGPARRVIVRARKGSGAACGGFQFSEQPPLILFAPDGRSSQAADLILREAQAMAWPSV